MLKRFQVFFCIISRNIIFKEHLNILHLSAANIWGGGENHLENLCFESKQLDAGLQHSILCIKGSRFHKKLATGDLDVIPAKLDFKMDPRYIFRIVRTCKQQRVDLIHIHDTTSLTLAVLADHFYDLPPFIFSKKTSYPIKDRKRTLHKYNYPKIKKILCVSEETKRIATKSIRDHEKLITVYHGTRLDNRSISTPFLLRDKMQIPEGNKIIGNLANHTSAKDLDTLIGVADQLVNKQNRKDLFFVQMGTFTKRTADLQMKIKALKLQQHFRFFGFVPEAWNFIPQFDLSLITSKSEGIPGFIYESCYHQVPVVSTAVGGIPEVIKHGRNGFLAPKHDIDDLCRHVLVLTEEEGVRNKFSRLSRSPLLKSFSTSKMARQTLAIYKEVIGETKQDCFLQMKEKITDVSS